MSTQLPPKRTKKQEKPLLKHFKESCTAGSPLHDDNSSCPFGQLNQVAASHLFAYIDRFLIMIRLKF